eukprot:GHVU01020342.1.p1 GENE.GHVU01020342.1~~GHVU01020342.1.p1  ORF type:complete len:237 (-),score=51.84 GHVU01020342.1:877-1587(-)
MTNISPQADALFANAYQSGFLSILYSIGSKPLELWDSKAQAGYIKRVTDEDLQSSVIEVVGATTPNTYICCPGNPEKTLGIKLPYFVMVIKNLKKYFSFEVQILDDKKVRRRFRASNFHTTTRVKPFVCSMPMKLDEGWNQIQFNLQDFVKRAYGSNYIETLRVTIHCCCRLRRVYFCDRLYSEEELPTEFRLYQKPAKKKEMETRRRMSNDGTNEQRRGSRKELADKDREEDGGD